MMATNLFNGKVYISRAVKLGSVWQLSLAFSDLNNHFKGSDVRQGDVVFCRGIMGESIRAVIQFIDSANVSTIVCKVLTDEPIGFIPLSNGALVRETTNWKYPMFPNGIPEAIRSIMLSYYAWLADKNVSIGSSSCTGELVTRKEVEGLGTICIQYEDGSSRKMTMLELKEYMLTLTSQNKGEEYRLDISSFGANKNRKV